MEGNGPMDSKNLGNNCYRAILAQVNSLEAVWPEPSYLKQIYEDLTELAFYMLEKDGQRVNKGVEQMLSTLEEVKGAFPPLGERHFIEVRMIISELKTHLEFLRLEYEKDYPSQYLCNPD